MTDLSPTTTATDQGNQPPRFSFGSAFSLGHKLLGKQYGGILLAVIVAAAIQFIAAIAAAVVDALLLGPNSFVTPFAWVVQVFVQTPTAVGPTMIAVLAYRTGRIDFSHIWLGFTRYWTIVGVAAIFTLASVLVMMPANIILLVTSTSGNLAGMLIGLALMLAAAVALVYLAIRFWFATLICVDPSCERIGVLGSLSTSWRITQGRALVLFGLGVVLGLITFAAFLALILPGILYALPMLTCVAGVTYVLVAHDSGLVPLAGYDDCPHCGYSLSGIAGSTCPECGAIVPRPA